MLVAITQRAALTQHTLNFTQQIRNDLVLGPRSAVQRITLQTHNLRPRRGPNPPCRHQPCLTPRSNAPCFSHPHSPCRSRRNRARRHRTQLSQRRWPRFACSHWPRRLAPHRPWLGTINSLAISRGSTSQSQSVANTEKCGESLPNRHPPSGTRPRATGRRSGRVGRIRTSPSPHNGPPPPLESRPRTVFSGFSFW